MKKSIKQIFCMLLAMLMLLSFAACGNESDNPTNTVESNEGNGSGETELPVDDPTKDDIGDVTFDDRTVRFYVRGYPTYAEEIFADQNTSDTVGFEIYKRQAAVQERFNIDILYTRTAESQAHGDVGEVRELVLAGNPDGIDVYCGSGYRVCPVSLEGVFVPYEEISYLDLSKDYWADYYIQEANITEHTYAITGSLALTTVKLMACTFFNQNLVSTLNLENPYDLVENKQWTLEKLSEISSQVYNDKNGNTTADALDLYGLSFSKANGITKDAFTSALDLRMLEKNENGVGVKLVVDAAKFQEATEALTELMWSEYTWNEGNLKAADQGDCVYFGNDLRVFLLGAVYLAEYSSFINMDSKYGVIPYPMMDTNQAEYYSYVEDQVSVFSVIKDSRNTDMIGAVLEAMSSYSYQNVMPVYYEQILKHRYLKDDQSGMILDMMVQNIRVDAAWCYNSEIKGLASLMRTLVESNYPYFSSSYSASIGTFEESVGKLLE